MKVESYNLKTQQWMSFPPLNKKKGSLGAVSFCDKIYAIGGGNASDCFSEVEMLDLDIGNWVLTRSMGQKVTYILYILTIKVLFASVVRFSHI